MHAWKGLTTDDLRELAVATEWLDSAHAVRRFPQLCCWYALQGLRQQLDNDHHHLLDEVWWLAKILPAGKETRLFDLCQTIAVRRNRDHNTAVLYRLRLLIPRWHDNWVKYTLEHY